MQQGPACLTRQEYDAIREIIDVFNLWWEEDEPPSRMSPALMMRGWSIVSRNDLAPLVGIAIRQDDVKLLSLREDAPLSVQALAIAHTLAHDVLGHRHAVDVIMTSGVRGLCCNRGVHPAHDAAAHAASALLLIPDRFVLGGYSIREVASWCGVTTNVVMRRVTGTMLVDDTPPNIVRIDRRASTRIWEPDTDPLSIMGGGK
jgi:hypothetical protein